MEHLPVSKTAVAGLIDADRARFTYGADYNPEQWSPEVWREDARLMREAYSKKTSTKSGRSHT